MSDRWTPSGQTFTVSTSGTPYLAVSASNQRLGVLRVVNVGTSHGHIALCTAAATAGEVISGSTIPPSTVFFIEFGHPFTSVIVSNSSLDVQPGYGLKG